MEVIKEGFLEEVRLEWRSKGWVGVGKGKGRASIPGRRKSTSKGTEVGMCRACLEGRKEDCVGWLWKILSVS